MSIKPDFELLKQLKELGIYRFKGADFEVEFFASKVYAGSEVALPLMQADGDAIWPELTEDPEPIDDGKKYRDLLEWSST
jgi:hypothetical protein